MTENFGATNVDTLTEEARQLIREEVARIRQELHGIEKELATIVDQQIGGTAPKQSAGGDVVTAGDLADARSVLQEIGATSNIVVVPNSVMLGKSNNAVTIKDPGKIGYYRDEALDASFYDDGVDFTALMKSIALDTIVVNLSVLNSPDLLKCGTIWHEQGHVDFGAAENGWVFAHEVRCLREKRSAEDAREFVLQHREKGDYYTKTAVEPGLSELSKELGLVGLTFEAGKKAAAQAQATKLGIGKRLTGSPEKLKQLAGAQDVPNLTGVDVGEQFAWHGHTWRLTFQEMRYKVTVSDPRQTSRGLGKSIEGTPAQIKKTASAFKDPPDFAAMNVGAEFSWEGAGWTLTSAQQYDEIVVVSSDT